MSSLNRLPDGYYIDLYTRFVELPLGRLRIQLFPPTRVLFGQFQQNLKRPQHLFRAYTVHRIIRINAWDKYLDSIHLIHTL